MDVCRVLDNCYNDVIELRIGMREPLRFLAYSPNPTDGGPPPVRTAPEITDYVNEGDPLQLYMLPNLVANEPCVYPGYRYVREEHPLGKRLSARQDFDAYPTYVDGNGVMRDVVNYEVRQRVLKQMVKAEMALMKSDEDYRTEDAERHVRYKTQQFSRESPTKSDHKKTSKAPIMLIRNL